MYVCVVENLLELLLVFLVPGCFYMYNYRRRISISIDVLGRTSGSPAILSSFSHERLLAAASDGMLHA